VTDIAAALVAIPSVNPDGGDPGTPHTGEAACAEWVAGFLRDCGAEVSLEEVLPGRPNVVGRFPAAREGLPRILFAPHLDTVGVAGMTIDPFAAEVRDGRLHGRGACDTKGPAASMLWALREAAPFLGGLPCEVWFAGLVGEEAGQHGALSLARRTTFDFVMAGEPTSMAVVHTHKGSHWLGLTTRGRAVHASAPHAGDNAIHKMVDAIDTLRHEVAPRLAEHVDPVLGPATMSIGTIRGGTKVNVVPDFCEAGVDVRTLPGMETAFIAEALRRRVPDIEVRSSGSEPLLTDPSHPLVAMLAGMGCPLAGAPWFCDASIFAAAGSPAVAIGPGDIAQAHTADEWVDTAALEEGGRFFLDFLGRLRGSRVFDRAQAPSA
jgi:acetylornithine deacetylase/succinyl-diaminopimelate desuccinylase-like protein